MTTIIDEPTDKEKRILASLSERQKQVLLVLGEGNFTAHELATKLNAPVEKIEETLETLSKISP